MRNKCRRKTQPPPPAAMSPADVTDEELVNKVKDDVQSLLKGGQWILSSYSPFTERPVIPGIPDVSPEEARLFIYEAKAYNNIDQVCRRKTQPPPPAAMSPADVTDEELVNKVKDDVQSLLKGGQWILTSYSPFTERPVIPGIPDVSPEEARLFIYEAKANNNTDQAVKYMNKLYKETRRKYEFLLDPSPSTIKVVRSVYNRETVSSPFDGVNTEQTGYGSSTSAAFVFGSPIQNVGAPIKNTFGKSENVAVNSIFGPANLNYFGPQPVPEIQSDRRGYVLFGVIL